MTMTIEQIDKILSLMLSEDSSMIRQALVWIETLFDLSTEDMVQTLERAIFRYQHTIEVCFVLDKIFTSEECYQSVQFK